MLGLSCLSLHGGPDIFQKLCSTASEASPFYTVKQGPPSIGITWYAKTWMEFNAFRSTITCILCNLADFTSPLPLPSFSPLFSPNEIIYGGTCNQTSLSRTRCDWFKTVNYSKVQWLGLAKSLQQNHWNTYRCLRHLSSIVPSLNAWISMVFSQ